MLKADKKYQEELDFFKRVREALDEGKSARSVECTPEEAELLSTVSLLTNKPVIYAANVSENDFKGGIENNAYFHQVKEIADSEHAGVLRSARRSRRRSRGWTRRRRRCSSRTWAWQESGLDRSSMLVIPSWD